MMIPRNYEFKMIFSDLRVFYQTVYPQDTFVSVRKNGIYVIGNQRAVIFVEMLKRLSLMVINE